MLVSVLVSFVIILVSAAIPIVHFFAFPISPFISGFVGASIGDLKDERIIYFGLLCAIVLFLPLFLLLESGVLGELKWYYSLLISFLLSGYVWFGTTIGALLKFWSSKKIR
tara:strand:- start:125 stop:457 length:333 start_codon:yes stop_codon:yes gene_type:complete